LYYFTEFIREIYQDHALFRLFYIISQRFAWKIIHATIMKINLLNTSSSSWVSIKVSLLKIYVKIGQQFLSVFMISTLWLSFIPSKIWLLLLFSSWNNWSEWFNRNNCQAAIKFYILLSSAALKGVNFLLYLLRKIRKGIIKQKSWR